jgi:hypothetical protein
MSVSRGQRRDEGLLSASRSGYNKSGSITPIAA